ncbi:hypothetical protein Tco_1144322 [Tanacetum coccineum]
MHHLIHASLLTNDPSAGLPVNNRLKSSPNQLLSYESVYEDAHQAVWNQRTVNSCWGLGINIRQSGRQKNGIQCFNCKGFRHYDRGMLEAKGVKRLEIDEQELEVTLQLWQDSRNGLTLRTQVLLIRLWNRTKQSRVKKYTALYDYRISALMGKDSGLLKGEIDSKLDKDTVITI